MKTLLIIPAYNEQENIVRTLQDIKANAPGMDYVVINDCSKDNTRKILKEYGANFLDLPVNLGIGGGVQTGYRYALEHDYDIAVQFDGDGQHDARYLSSLIAPIISGEADAAIGSRFIEKEGFQSSAMRRFGISFLSSLIKLLSGVKIYDVTSGFRAVNRSMIAFFAENYPQDYPEPDAILLSTLEGFRLVEVPAQMRERVGGQSSISSFRAVYYMVKVSISLIVSRLSHKRRKIK
ncbi:MAG: glycosyltransferase family 2 protein [Oscillospiraceae bacterium]|nr:glycosyltransferase family 2 protein [Oscillospiraceae bacterium]